jgi:sigma-B regulation protein RsbU (phosphoserine phosphatase)
VSARDRIASSSLPDSIQKTLADFEDAFQVSIRLSRLPSDPRESPEVVYASVGFDGAGNQAAARTSVGAGRTGIADVPVDAGTALDAEVAARRVLEPREGRPMAVEISEPATADPEALARLLASTLDRELETAREVRFFTYELSERYEEINLLYSISETLGSILHLDDAARVIVGEVCDVMGALRGSLWVHNPKDSQLHLRAAVGKDGLEGPLPDDDPDLVTSTVFREGRSVIASRVPPRGADGDAPGESFLSVPIRYTPPAGESRTVGVINLIGRRGGERFSAADQKLLSAIASQVGAALENNRLIKESVSKERMAREMELAHDLQMKLLPEAERFEAAEAAARVSPAEQVGGDFYQLFRLSGGRVGVMLGDVSLHGFPSALIMTLTMSAAGIYAREHDSPARVLREMDDALRDELETTEMFLTVFYGVVDPSAGTLTYSNAGHPHAFVVHEDGGLDRLTATDPPVGFAGPESYTQTRVDWTPETDLLLLFTDGLSDILSHGTRNDGEERVLDTVVTHRADPAERIVEELFRLTADANPPIQGDDRTALVVRL